MYECYRCQRSFAARHSLEQHKRNSPYHHECHYCSNDYVDRDDWEDHMEDMHGHCWYCDEGFNYRTQHLIDQHNMCEQCGQCFGSPNSVRQHAQTHMPRDKDCIGGCNKAFISISAMLLHLEPGACRTSDISREEINELAFDSRNMDGYMTYTGPRWKRQYTFECATCSSTFYTISGLYQHVESDYCNESLHEPTHWSRQPLNEFIRELERYIEQYY